MRTRAKLKRWFKEANRTISKFFLTPHHKKRKNYDGRKAPKANASVNTISSDVEVIYSKQTHNKLKASKGRIFRHSERDKSSKKRSPTRQTNTSSKKRRRLLKEDTDSKYFTHDLSQSSTSKQISSKFERVSLISSGGSQLQSEKIYENIRKDREYYKKLLQLTSLIHAKKRDADNFGLHKHQRDYILNNYHKFSFKNDEGKCSRSIRAYAIKESFSETSLSKTESSNMFYADAKQKAILKKLLQNQKVTMPLEIVTNPKNDGSKVLVNKMSYNSLKVKFSQIRKLLMDRKTSASAKEKCSWGGQIIIPTYMVQSTKEADTQSVVKMYPLIEPHEGEETELHVHTLTAHPETLNTNNRVSNKFGGSRSYVSHKTPKTQDGLTCGQNPLIRQSRIPNQTANCRNYVPDKSSTTKSSTKVQDTTKHVQEGLRCGQNPLVKQKRIPNEIHKSYIPDRPLVTAKSTTKTQDTSKQAREGLRCGESPLFKQNKISSEARSCKSYGSDGPLSVLSTKTQDITKQALICQSSLLKQSEITEYTPDGHVKTTKSFMKTQDAPEQEGFRSSQSLKRNRFSNEPSGNYAPASTEFAFKSSGHGSQLSQNETEKPLIITIKDPEPLTLTSECSVYKNEIDSCKCNSVKNPRVAYPVRVVKCPREIASQGSQTPSRSKKKSSGCCKSSSKKSHSHSPSSASTSSFNTSSHSPVSSPSGKESSTSTPRRESSSDQLAKPQKCSSSCNSNKVTPRPTPSPPLRVDPSPPCPKRSKKSSSSTSYCGRPKRKKSKSPPPPSPKGSKKSSSSTAYCGRPKRKKSKSPPPPINRSTKGSSVSFSEAPHSKLSTPYPQGSCKAQNQSSPKKSSSYCFSRRTQSKPSMTRRSSKSKGPRYCGSCKRKSEIRMAEKRVTNLNANKDLQRPPIVQPVLGMCNLKTCGTPILDIKYAIVRITYFKNYTTYEMMRSTSVKPKKIPNYVEKIFVTKETKFAIT